MEFTSPIFLIETVYKGQDINKKLQQQPTMVGSFTILKSNIFTHSSPL